MSESSYKLLHDVTRAVADAIASSQECQEAIRRVHQEGLSLYLAIDRRPHRDAPALMEIMPQDKKDQANGPGFRLDSRDVAFLESVGIDTTRSRPRRR
ncbi:MAG: hypothetical protein AAF368_17785 [Planctomycetota bacterium]